MRTSKLFSKYKSSRVEQFDTLFIQEEKSNYA